MLNRCTLSQAQRAYDNRMPDENPYPEEMDCPECGSTVDLEDTGFMYNVELTGTCANCGCECEFDLDNF